MHIATVSKIRQQTFITVVSALVLLLGLGVTPAQAQIGSSQKISNADGGFGGTLNSGDFLGRAVADLGDLNSDGNQEVAVSATGTDGGGTNRGALWILSLKDDGTVASEQQIDGSDIGDGLDDNDDFGWVENAGDIDGDGTTDLAVGAPTDGEGAVWILFLEPDGTVSSFNKITSTDLGGSLDSGDGFGTKISGIGDLNGDNTPDLAVGAFSDEDGGVARGAVWILFLNSGNNGNGAGTVSGFQKISDTDGGFGGTLDDGDNFSLVADIGDLNNDGVQDLAVGAPGDDDGGQNRGAVWILRMNDDGTVAGHEKISDTVGGFGGTLDNNDVFGINAASGDLNADGNPDLLVAAERDDDGGSDLSANRGAVWVLYLNDDGTVSDHVKISDTQGGFGGTLDDGDQLGFGLTSLGDLDGDGNPDLAVGAPGDDDGATDAGALWVMFGDSPALPVELAGFDAVRTGDSAAELTWTTASEQNNAGFVVQHRTSAKDASWDKVGFVESKAGGGTTSTETSYTFPVENLSVGSHEFRLKQRDLDGSTHLHDPTTVALQMQKGLRLSTPAPNPVQSRAAFTFAVKEATKTTITLYNTLGQQVRTVYQGTPPTEQTQTLRLDADGLASGAYFLRLRANGQTQTERVTILK